MSGHELTETDKNAHDSVSEYGDKNSQRRSNLHQEEEILYLECLKIDTDCMPAFANRKNGHCTIHAGVRGGHSFVARRCSVIKCPQRLESATEMGPEY